MTYQPLSSVLFASLLALGCGGESKDESKPTPSSSSNASPAKASAETSTTSVATTPSAVKPDIALSADQKAKVSQIEAAASGDTSPDESLYRDDVEVTLHLALTSTDRAVARAMFREIARWAGAQRDKIDPRALAVTRYRITTDARPIEPMFDAMHDLLQYGGADLDVMHDLAAIATTHADMGARRAALRALHDVRYPNGGAADLDDATLAAMELAVLDIDDVPALIAALDLGVVFTRDAAALDVLIARTEKLTEHANPGVRGGAFERLVSLLYAEVGANGSPDFDAMDARLGLVERALDDEHPYVRGNAISVLQLLLVSPPVIDKLVALTADEGKVDYHYDFEQAGGGVGRYIGGMGDDTVGDSAIDVLEMIAQSWSYVGLPEVDAIELQSWSGLEAGDPAAIKAWYAQHDKAIAAAYPAVLAAMKSRS